MLFIPLCFYDITTKITVIKTCVILWPANWFAWTRLCLKEEKCTFRSLLTFNRWRYVFYDDFYQVTFKYFWIVQKNPRLELFEKIRNSLYIFLNKWSKLTMVVTQVLADSQKGVTPHWVLWKLEIVHSFSDYLSENIKLSRHLLYSNSCKLLNSKIINSEIYDLQILNYQNTISKFSNLQI